MKRLVWGGAAAFLLTLIVILPVGWVAGFLPPGLQCTAWSGSVWRGQCAGLIVNQPGAAPLQVNLLRWKLHASALLRLALLADFDVDTPQGNGRGQIELARRGLVTLKDVSATAAFDRRLFTSLAEGSTGQLQGRHLNLRLQGVQLQALSGELSLLGFNDGRGNAFGSYRLVFPDAGAPPFMGRLADIDGPVEVAGTLSVTAERSWKLDAQVAPRPGAPPGLRNRLDIFGAPDGNGRYPLRVEGTFK